MERKNTPGKWSVNGNNIDGNGYHIASVNSHRTSEGEANSRLIAAAPELLDAAMKALQYLEERNLDGGQVGASLFNAISKAIGK